MARQDGSRRSRPSRRRRWRVVTRRWRVREARAALAARGGPTDREGLVAVLRNLLEDVSAGPGRVRMLAYLELQAEAARRPWLAEVLDPVAAADFAGFEAMQRAAGLPATRERAALVTLALHGAIPHLLARGRDTGAASGLNDLDHFVRNALETAYPGYE
ncbi:TetR/AcrR family transcriptional regulator [Streptomyces sp. MUM 203J]|nr:TetR/AcrR family transcriptional regulator [Streptomyces sp. MUM 203J]